MDKNERANKMARLAFNKGNMEQVKEGVDQLFQVFMDILEEPFDHDNYFSHDDVMARLELVEQKKWRQIRNMFLMDPVCGYVQGDFTKEENASPAKILLDFVSVLNEIQRNCVERLEKYKEVVNTLNKDKRELEGQLAQLELKESQQRMAARYDRTAAKTATGSVEYLEKIVKEKNEKIAELQREKNVQLWEREKEKALAEYKTRMDLLESRNAELKNQNESLQKKLTMIDDRHKMLKMKTELLSGEIPPTRNKTEEELKQIIYLQEKDLTAMERELLSQQRVFYTVLCGIKTDLFIVGESLSDPDTGQIPSKDFVRLTGMVETLATAMADGDIEPARKDLPPHYTYLPANFKVKRIKRVSNLSGNKLPPIHGSEPRSQENTDTDTNGTNNGIEYFVDTIEANPVLVDPNTDSVNFMTCMKHFPHLSMEFVKEHWVRFKEFDANGDQSLDFSEVVRALTAMGLKFNAHQAEEAMREADVNHSHTLDFFEYVLVVDKLIHRTGRSELFHAAPQDRKVLSKTCVVQ